LFKREVSERGMADLKRPWTMNAEQWVATSLRKTLETSQRRMGRWREERGKEDTIEGTQTRDSTCPYMVKLVLLKYMKSRTNNYKISSHNQRLYQLIISNTTAP
jgi:hypothetical protein